MNSELLRASWHRHSAFFFLFFFVRMGACDYHLVNQRCLVGAVVAVVVVMVAAAPEHELLGSVSILGGTCVDSRLFFSSSIR